MKKCLYLTDKNVCRILNAKQCSKCSFYKEYSEENYNKYIMEVEKDILLYKSKYNMEGS